MPGVVVVPAPYRGDYVYQALKPAVIVLCDDNLVDENIFKEGDKERVIEHIKEK